MYKNSIFYQFVTAQRDFRKEIPAVDLSAV